ncbi:MAG: hypothetical protein WKF40_02380 [Thermoleophilaceae bacterium]
MFDQTAPMVAIWWNQPWVARELGEGSQVVLHGKLKGRNQFHVAEHELIGAGGPAGHSVGLVPVHPATYGLTAATLRKLIWEDYGLIRHVAEPLPSALRVVERLSDRPAALAATHFPDSEEEEAGARRRLAFEELFLSQLAVAGRRRARGEGAQGAGAAGRRRPRGAVAGRPALRAHRRSRGARARRSTRTCEQGVPMQRLLMGEVGLGQDRGGAARHAAGASTPEGRPR